MALTSEEIHRRLGEFVTRWIEYAGSERAEAQTFLNQLLECFGTDRQQAGARFEERGGGGFMDMIWPGVCIVEMKRPSEADRLELHREQAFGYWKEVQRLTGAAGRFVVLSAFRAFEVFEPGARWDIPLAQFRLDELPDKYESLDFLREHEPRFETDRADLTREAVALVTDLYGRILDRYPTADETPRDFVLQSVWCMFAEDFGMIPERGFTSIVDGLLDHADRSSADDLGGLFERLNTPGARPEHGLYAGAPYADGGLFESPAHVHLEPDEVELLREACRSNWKLVEPSIFGNLLEGALGRERVWAFGAHYTSEADIRKVVEPTIVEPWRERIDACSTLAELAEAQRAFGSYAILDPACGSGNFLYIAYRELRRTEAKLRAKERELRREAGLPEGPSQTPAYPLSNVHGIELEPFAVKLARVTLWMGHKLAVEELGLDEAVLPLADLSEIRRGDALKIEWPHADAIIGNPPYHGSQQIRSELGDEYAEWLKSKFRVGLKDYAVYWFRKAHEALPDGARAGLVATNSVSQGRSREVSLQWLVENDGVITNAVSRLEWSGPAVVNVSIVNWTKRPGSLPSGFILDGTDVPGITASLLATGDDVTEAGRLVPNRGKAFQGPMAVGKGFILSVEAAESLLQRAEADYRDVVRPFLVGDDIAEDPRQRARRFVIDLGIRTLEDARRYPAALEILRDRVKRERETNPDRFRREKWWLLGRPVVALRYALKPLPRYIAGTRVGKRILFCWCDPWTSPSDAVNAFAFDDDFAIGILLSSEHHEWARAQSSTLRVDIRYTPTTAFGTFPWPQPTDGQRDEVAELSQAVVTRRQEICLERQIGLTKLYNEIDDGAYRDLSDLHRLLDEAVAVAYGWPKSAAHDPADSNRRLLELNQAIAEGRVEYDPF